LAKQNLIEQNLAPALKVVKDDYGLIVASPKKRIDESDSSKQENQPKHSERQKDQFYSDEEDDSSNLANLPVKEEEDEDEDTNDAEEQEKLKRDYELNPITKPFDIKGLLQIK
jgi:hypothetical protein